MSNQTRAEVVIEFSARDVITLEDGYEYFDTPRGGLSAYDLRIIASDLDRRNAAWDAKVQELLNVTRRANPVEAAGPVAGETEGETETTRGGMMEENRYKCPCLIADEPCHKGCPCKKPHMSHACFCCARHGSAEQRKSSANRIVRVCREAAILVAVQASKTSMPQTR